MVGAIIYWIMEVNAERKYDLGAASTDKVVLADLFRFSQSYWYIVALCIVFYSGIFPFQTFAVKFFMEAHGTYARNGRLLVQHADPLRDGCHARCSGSLWTRWANEHC